MSVIQYNYVNLKYHYNKIIVVCLCVSYGRSAKTI